MGESCEVDLIIKRNTDEVHLIFYRKKAVCFQAAFLILFGGLLARIFYEHFVEIEYVDTNIISSVRADKKSGLNPPSRNKYINGVCFCGKGNVVSY